MNGEDLAAPTVTRRLDESGSQVYSLTYQVKGTRAGSGLVL